MKKPIWIKFIIFVAVFMITVNGILPTNVSYAADDVLVTEDDASIFERIICGLLVFIGTGIYAMVRLIIGESFSIDKVIFNGYSKTKLSFFESDIAQYGENTFLEEGNIRKALNIFFDFFRGLAIVVYLIILVYMGIRILLGSTAEKGSKHKELIVYWLQGIIILFVFPYVMKYAIHINNAFVSFVEENRNRFISEELNGSSVRNVRDR